MAGCPQALLSARDAELELFVHGVRRFYPCFPLVAGHVRQPLDWRGEPFEKGRSVLLDIYLRRLVDRHRSMLYAVLDAATRHRAGSCAGYGLRLTITQAERPWLEPRSLCMSSPGEPGGAAAAAGSRSGIETLAWLSEAAFEGDAQHSLLANLRALSDEHWTAVPPGGSRSIADILEHVAWAKWMYEDYAFGSASLRGDQPPLVPEGGLSTRPRDQLLAWLSAGQRRWLASVLALPADAELDRERLTNWGAWLPTRTLIRILIAHDLYHAGEINHLRSLLQGTDRWAYQS